LTLKILKKLRPASLNSEFTGSSYKKVYCYCKRNNEQNFVVEQRATTCRSIDKKFFFQVRAGQENPDRFKQYCDEMTRAFRSWGASFYSHGNIWPVTYS